MNPVYKERMHHEFDVGWRIAKSCEYGPIQLVNSFMNASAINVAPIRHVVISELREDFLDVGNAL